MYDKMKILHIMLLHMAYRAFPNETCAKAKTLIYQKNKLQTIVLQDYSAIHSR